MKIVYLLSAAALALAPAVVNAGTPMSKAALPSSKKCVGSAQGFPDGAGKFLSPIFRLTLPNPQHQARPPLQLLPT
jgi:hypothetical protein